MQILTLDEKARFDLALAGRRDWLIRDPATGREGVLRPHRLHVAVDGKDVSSTFVAFDRAAGEATCLKVSPTSPSPRSIYHFIPDPTSPYNGKLAETLRGAVEVTYDWPAETP